MDDIQSDDLTVDGDGDDIFFDSKRLDIKPSLFEDLWRFRICHTRRGYIPHGAHKQSWLRFG